MQDVMLEQEIGVKLYVVKGDVNSVGKGEAMLKGKGCWLVVVIPKA